MLHLLSLAQAADVVLAPQITNFTNAVAMILLQGAQISAAQYLPLAYEIQDAAARNGTGLWIAIPEFPGSIVQPELLESTYTKMVAAMTRAGLPSNRTLFLAGHSLGGAMLQGGILANNTQRFKGVVLMGSFVERVYNKSWNVPVLQIAAQVDGMCRITRMAQAFLLQLLNRGGLDNATAVRDFPVGVIPGSSHMQFASGKPPLLVLEKDLKPFITEKDAHAQTAFFINEFFQSQSVTRVESALMRSWVADSGQKYFRPILQAMELEGNYFLQPPCNCNNPLTPPYGRDPFGYVNFYPCLNGTYVPGTCRTGTRWGQFIQERLSNLSQINYNVTSAFHPVDQTKPNSNLPYVFNNCSKPDQSCTLQITIVNQNLYQLQEGDTGFKFQSAIEIRAKMASRQKVWLRAGVPNPKFNDTDGEQLSLCREMNKLALDWAVKHATKDANSRYQSIGQKIVFGQDEKKEGGPGWIDTHLSFKPSGDTVVVASPSIAFPEPFALEISAGLHYCKLLSPARALQWLMIDSLRLKNSLRGESARS